MGYSSSTLLELIVIVSLVLTPITIIGHNNDNLHSKSPLVYASHCHDKCGNVSIPYPFGLDEGCYLKEKYSTSHIPYYKIRCNDSMKAPRVIFGENVELLSISLETHELRVTNNASYDCYESYNHNQMQLMYGGRANTSIQTGRFTTMSSTKNVLVAMGCDTLVWFSGFRDKTPYHTGCLTRCEKLDYVIDTDGICNGVGCCETSLPDGVTNITTKVVSMWNHTNATFNPCSAAFPVERDVFRFHKSYLTRNYEYFRDELRLPIVFDWGIGTQSCDAARSSGDYLCKNNTDCENPPNNQVGYRCKCKNGFTGNPYLPQGCSDVDECMGADHKCEKAEYCVNDIGDHHCKCPKGYKGEGTKDHPCVSYKDTWLIPVLATAGIGGGIITLLVIGFVWQWKHGEKRLREMQEYYFQQNGGLLLDEKIARREVETFKKFTVKELEIASNYYSKENIIGRGGFGIVYKGILPNNQVVAIKKSLKVDPNQVEQFINEVVVLSQIKNKFVVKLLGCCLESEVPFLVYEFINNGTLYEHLNNEVIAFNLSWDLRLKIASQVANVLSYLHNTISTPIIHGDMKSMNILLDECYTAKVIDFGTSRLAPPDESQFATMVMGTRGYLDPEYLRSSELTAKSDVYSFGVVLVELLTRKKVYSDERPDIEKCLAMHFLLKMKEGSLIDILDKRILSEGTIEDIKQVANLAKWCLMLKGEERPTMEEVAVELESIKRKGSHAWHEDESYPEDRESLLVRVSRLDIGGCSSGIESSSYDSQILSSLGSGR